MVQLRRDVRAFFQGNRFLLRPFVESICAAVETPSAVDLYAGVGLFGLALAARGTHVTLVEGDPTSAADLDVNAAALGGDVRTVHDSVERYLSTATWPDPVTVVADPPRTGLSAEARSLLLDRRPRRVVYVSCDPATLARDARPLFDAGYRLVTVRGFDLFPMTAHIESVVVFDRG